MRTGFQHLAPGSCVSGSTPGAQQSGNETPTQLPIGHFTAHAVEPSEHVGVTGESVAPTPHLWPLLSCVLARYFLAGAYFLACSEEVAAYSTGKGRNIDI